MNKFLEMFKDKNVVHISDSDFDGIGCVLMGEVYLEPICASYYPYVNSDRSFKDIPMDIIGLADVVLFTDIAPMAETYITIKEMGKVIIICDHHDTSYDILKDLNIEHYYYDNTRCGAKILFDKIFENTRPPKIVKDVVDLVNVYDTWQKDNLLWQQANDLCDLFIGSINYRIDDSYSANYSYLKNMKLKFKFQSIFEYTENELRIIKERKDKREKIYHESLKTLEKRIDSRGDKYIFCSLSSGISALGNRFAEDNPDCKYVVIFNTYSKVKALMKMSLRSVDFNVREIAEKWGGGGHLESSSFHFASKGDFDLFLKGEMHLI